MRRKRKASQQGKDTRPAIRNQLAFCGHINPLITLYVQLSGSMLFAVLCNTNSDIFLLVCLSIPIFRLHIVGEGLGLLVSVVVMVVVVMRVFRCTDIVHSVDAAALVASLEWAFSRHLCPVPNKLVICLDAIGLTLLQPHREVSWECEARERTYHQPSDDVRIGGTARAANLDFFSGRFDGNGVFKGACRMAHQHSHHSPE